jgi:hypothetical protein
MARVGDYLETSAYHTLLEVPASALESGKVIDPWN